jgi:hypothetical protein
LRNVVALCALSLAACGGIEEEEFATQYATQWCEHELACADEAELNFEGIATVDDCTARYLPEVASWGDGCSYDSIQAEVCLADMESLTCPADGGLGDPPVSCSSVYVQCALDDGGGDDTDQG